MTETDVTPLRSEDLTPAGLAQKLQIIADGLAEIGRHIEAAHVQTAVDLLQKQA